MRSLIDWILGRTHPDAVNRVTKDAEVTELVRQSEATERRVDRLIRLARIDAEVQVRAKKR